jgi:uncharacterized protein (DUF433 family)
MCYPYWAEILEHFSELRFEDIKTRLTFAADRNRKLFNFIMQVA